jgi:hypothetical protein
MKFSQQISGVRNLAYNYKQVWKRRASVEKISVKNNTRGRRFFLSAHVFHQLIVVNAKI